MMDEDGHRIAEIVELLTDPTMAMICSATAPLARLYCLLVRVPSVMVNPLVGFVHREYSGSGHRPQ